MPGALSKTEPNLTLSKLPASGICAAIQSLLDRCGMNYPSVPSCPGYRKACYLDLEQRLTSVGVSPADIEFVCKRFLPAGIAVTITAFAHLPSEDTRVWISSYSALIIYLDDMFEKDVTAVIDFNTRFISNKPQANFIIDAFAIMLREMPERFGQVVADLMLISNMNFVTSLTLEHQLQNKNISTDAENYVRYLRMMTGDSLIYILFMFPPEIPFQKYVQAIPDMMCYFNNVNDILSLYKEELADEAVNTISLLSACRGASKASTLWQLVDETVDAHTRTTKILSASPDALKVWKQFDVGYIGFFAALDRYKLDELRLQTVSH